MVEERSNKGSVCEKFYIRVHFHMCLSILKTKFMNLSLKSRHDKHTVLANI